MMEPGPGLGVTVHAHHPVDEPNEPLERALEVAFDARPSHLRYRVEQTADGDIAIRFETCA